MGEPKSRLSRIRCAPAEETRMPEKTVVILDDAGSGDKDLPPILSVLSHVLQSRRC